MKIICTKDYEDLSRKAAELIAEQILLKPDSVLGLATGGTPLGIYRCLTQLYRNDQIDFSSVTTLNLDEYVGMAPDNPGSYAYFMEQNLFSHVNISPERCHIPSGLAKSADAECRRYDQLISVLGGIDLQLLGLGNNGHIGFNEPSDTFTAATHCVALSESTRSANARFFSSLEEVPTQAITMGMNGIMNAKQILLCVSETSKSEILREVLFGPVTPSVPGSVLQYHPNLTVIADADACSCLPSEYRY
ncbi:MAG: glucosamine-6-phosphate deaminase [Firmicutes bacterium]|nr:glucosamine-6-phosphate deaminase [Bacillota bacterium]